MPARINDRTELSKRHLRVDRPRGRMAARRLHRLSTVSRGSRPRQPSALALVPFDECYRQEALVGVQSKMRRSVSVLLAVLLAAGGLAPVAARAQSQSGSPTSTPSARGTGAAPPANAPPPDAGSPSGERQSSPSAGPGGSMPSAQGAGATPPGNAPPLDAGSPSGAKQSNPSAGPGGSMPPRGPASPIYPPAHPGGDKGTGAQKQ